MVYHKDVRGCLIPQRIHAVAISPQHISSMGADNIKESMMEHVVRQVCPKELLDGDTIYAVSTEGRRPKATGMSGRSAVADTYGGWVPAAGSISGKDSSKLQRFGVYIARHAAKSLVHAGFCSRCRVQVCYALGMVQPLSISVDTYGTTAVGLLDQELCAMILRNFDFRPGVISCDFDLKAPKFHRVSVNGHCGRTDVDVAWEKPKDLTHEMQKALEKVKK